MKIFVLGAGTMGAGIAQAFASKGYEVILLDIAECDLVVEAAVENMQIKKQIFAELDEICGENASND